MDGPFRNLQYASNDPAYSRTRDSDTLSRGMAGEYANAPDPPRRAAVFRWSAADGVTMELLDPKWSRLARQYYTRRDESDAVTRDE